MEGTPALQFSNVLAGGNLMLQHKETHARRYHPGENDYKFDGCILNFLESTNPQSIFVFSTYRNGFGIK